MPFKYKLLAYILFLNLIMIVCGFIFMQSLTVEFMIFEAFWVVSSVAGILLFRQFSKPFDMLAAGVESLKDQDFSMKLKPKQKGEFKQLIDVYNRMIDQLRQERVALSEKSFLLTKLMEASPSGIIIFDFDDCVSQMNSAAEKFIGQKLDKVKGVKLHVLSEMCDGLFDSISEKHNYIHRKGGSSQIRIQNASFIDRGFETRFVLIEDLGVEIFKAEKSSYEKVIRMMSHEVNNSVAAVNSMLQTLQPRITENKYAQALSVCVERNDNMNKFMRNFASVVRVPKANFMKFDLNKLLKRIIDLNAHNLENKRIELQNNLNTAPLLVTGDETQLEQVFMNVFKNAVEAIAEEGFIAFYSFPEEKKVVIKNNGEPIGVEQRKKLFTPFYSTKEKGQGIGLTLTREILTQHNCSFALETIADETQFVVSFK